MIDSSPNSKQENKVNLLNKRIKGPKFSDYFYLFLLLCFSGNPFFTGSQKYSKIIAVIATLIFIVLKNRKLQIPESKHLYIFLGFFSIIFAFQYFILGFVSVPGAIAYLLKFVFGFLIIATIGSNFKIVYLNTIYFISIISLVGFSWNLIGNNIPTFYELEGTSRSIIFYTQRIGLNTVRNSGMFWEPGVFACYIILGFSFFIGNIRELFKKNKQLVIVIIVALLTTYSTTGYLTFFVFSIYTILKEYSKTNLIISITAMTLFLVIFYQVYSKSDFLKDKIESQYKLAQNRDGDFGPDRMSAFLFELQYIQKHPLFGNGMHEKTNLADHTELIGERLGAGNGFSGFISNMGILSLLFYVYYILKYKESEKLIFVIILLLLLQGEPLMNFPMFLTIPFIYLFNETTRSKPIRA